MSAPTNVPFNEDQQLVAMKQDIADRAFNIKLKGYLISGALAVAAIGALFVFPAALGMAAPLVGLALAAGSGISALFTMKESEKLNIDRQYLETRMQGGNWGAGHWAGYRREVAEHGYAGPQAPGAFAGPPSRNPRGSEPNRG